MPLNLNKYNFEAKRLSLKGRLRARPDEYRFTPGTPGEETVPNQPPQLPAPIPQKTEGTPGDLQNAVSLFQTLSGKPSGAIPGQQPGTPFNMAAVNAPEAGRSSPASTFDPVKFAQIAGMAGAALAPRGKYGSWQKDLGLAAAGLAGQELAERKAAPDLALDRRLKEAQIKKAERPERPYRSRSIVDVRLNPETGVWEHGGFDPDTGGWTRYRDATEAEIESEVEGKPIDPDEIDIHGDIAYPGSSGPRTLRDAHQGAVSSPQPSRALLKDALAGYGSGLEDAITGAKGTNVPPEGTKGATDDSLIPDEQPEMPETGIDYTPEDLKKGPAQPPGAQKTGKGKIPPKPPDSILSAEGQRDFKDRQAYSASVIAGMEFDPFTLDPNEEVEKSQELLPELFERAFPNILWRDRDTLTKDEKQYWNDVCRASNVQVKDAAKEKVKRGQQEYKMHMKGFEDHLSETKAMPKALEASLKSIYISTDKFGTKTGEIPPTIRSQAIVDAEELVNTGKMSGAEAVAFVIQKLGREKLQAKTIKDALSYIPEMETGWFGLGSEAKEVDDVKSLITDAMEQGADENEIKDRLKSQGWDDKNIKKVFPEKTYKIEGQPEAGITQEYKTPESIRDAFKSGKFGDPESDEARQKAKQYLRQAIG